MTIFKYELRQLKWHTFWWSVACALLIFGALPTYMSFLTTGAIDMSVIADNAVFEMRGIDRNTLATPMGVFGFLTSFAAIAAGIQGMFLGLKTFTKETIGRSSEFLYTKPYKRSKIFIAKVLAALLSSVIIGACY